MRPDLDDIPDLAFSLDLRSIRASMEVEDGDLVLHLHDGHQHIVIETGAGGSYATAATGAEHLADLALQFAGLVKVRAGSRTPLTIEQQTPGQFVDTTKVGPAAVDEPGVEGRQTEDDQTAGG
jgi:hypothetical protein